MQPTPRINVNAPLLLLPLKMASTAGERIYRARRTILQMLRDRGYMVDSTDVDESEEGFFEKFTPSPQRDALTLLVQCNPKDSAIVVTATEPPRKR